MSDASTSDLFDRMSSIRLTLVETESDRRAKAVIGDMLDGMEKARLEGAELRRLAEEIFGDVTDEVALFIAESRTRKAAARPTR